MATTTMGHFLLRPSPLSTRKLRHVSTRSSQTDCPVPLDQQPVNEYKSLSESVPFSWAARDEFESRLFLSGAAFALAVGFPVAWVGSQAGTTQLDEETGWYDGQIWVKNAEVLARDRLLGSFSVKPVLSRLKNTLVVLAASLFVCAIMLINLESKQKNLYNISNEPGGRAVPGVYNDESARSFEPDAFCGEPDLQ